MFSEENKNFTFLMKIFRVPTRDGTLKIFIKKEKNVFFSETLKNHVFRKKFFHLFEENFQSLNARWVSENFRLKSKKIIFFRNAQKSCFQKKMIFHLFDDNFLSPNARWDSENFRQKSKRKFLLKCPKSMFSEKNNLSSF